MGNDEDNLDRKLQAEVLAKMGAEFENAKIPVVFLGYVTSRPYRFVYALFIDEPLKWLHQGNN